MTSSLARDLGDIAAAEADEIAYGWPPREHPWSEGHHNVAHDWWKLGRDAAVGEVNRLYGVAREWWAVADELDARSFRASAAAQFQRTRRTT